MSFFCQGTLNFLVVEAAKSVADMK
jgi:hypothetical protein